MNHKTLFVMMRKGLNGKLIKTQVIVDPTSTRFQHNEELKRNMFEKHKIKSYTSYGIIENYKGEKHHHLIEFLDGSPDDRLKVIKEMLVNSEGIATIISLTERNEIAYKLRGKELICTITELGQIEAELPRVRVQEGQNIVAPELITEVPKFGNKINLSRKEVDQSKIVFHYTNLMTLDRIIESKDIKVSRWEVDRHYKHPVVWLSKNAVWEPYYQSANRKHGTNKGPRHKPKEIERKMYGLGRIGVELTSAIINAKEYSVICKMDDGQNQYEKHHLANLESKEKEWFASLSPIPASEWVCVQYFDGEVWKDYQYRDSENLTSPPTILLV